MSKPLVARIHADSMHRWIAPALRTAGNDFMLPVLSCAQFHVRDDHLLIITTDRFRASLSRVRQTAQHKLDWDVPAKFEPFDVHVSAGQLRGMLSMFRTGTSSRTRRRIIEVQLTPDGVTFVDTFSKAQLHLPRYTEVDHAFPDVLSLFVKKIEGVAGDPDPCKVAALSVNFDYLADFRHAVPGRAAAVVITPTGNGVVDPFLVPMHEDYLGLLMPRRPLDTPEDAVVFKAPDLLAVWGDALPVVTA